MIFFRHACFNQCTLTSINMLQAHVQHPLKYRVLPIPTCVHVSERIDLSSHPCSGIPIYNLASLWLHLLTTDMLTCWFGKCGQQVQDWVTSWSCCSRSSVTLGFALSNRQDGRNIIIDEARTSKMQNKVILNTKYSLAFCALKTAFTLAQHGTALQLYQKVNNQESERASPCVVWVLFLKCQILIFLLGYFCCYV